MVGPILGPTLGGWLTENYDWRWVFFVNLPVGVLTGVILRFFYVETSTIQRRPFDLFGFAMLSLAIGALQLMLDRGESQDWFGSTEILVELCLAASGLWVFIVHAATAPHPFVSIAIFRDRNFFAAILLVFIIGIMQMATLALLPPLLQELMNYPVITTGLMMAPRGIGTMAGMLMVPWLARFDVRIVMTAGLVLSAASLWLMTGYSLEMDGGPIFVTGILQGLGIGLVFVPLSTVGYATLAPHLRTEAASLFSLVRNIGGSIGISIVENVLARSIQANHASLVEHVTQFSSGSEGLGGTIWNIHSLVGLTALDAEINRQATMIAYINDFKLMMLLTVLTMPFVLLLRRADPRRPVPGATAIID